MREYERLRLSFWRDRPVWAGCELGADGAAAQTFLHFEKNAQIVIPNEVRNLPLHSKIREIPRYRSE